MTVKKFFGHLLRAGGILMAVLAGGCGLVFMVVDISFGELVLILGGVPCLIGIGLFYWGKNILKKENVDVEKDMSVWD